MRKYAAAVTALVATLVAVLVWDASPGADEGVVVGPGERPADPRSADPVLPEMTQRAEEVELRESIPGVVEVASGLRRSGRVVDEAGEPVGGAQISWGPLPLARSGPPPDWKAVDVDRLRGATRWTETDATGEFSFADSPETLDGSVLWVTHPAYRAAYSVLPAGPGFGELGPIVLEEVPIRSATVMAEGEEVEGASVHQLADPTGAGGGQNEGALRAFLREWRADASGRTSLATLPSGEGLVATAEGLQSEPRTGPSIGDVIIELLPAFRAQGLVSLAQGPAVPEDVAVSYEARIGDDFDLRGRAAVRPDGRWGPVAIPLSEVEQYRFSVGGGGVVRKVVEVPVPRDTGRVTVDFATMMGISQWFSLIDSSTKEPLREAQVEVHWQEEDGAWTVIDSRTRDDGYIKVGGCRPGMIWYTGRHSGYAFRRAGPEVIPLDPPKTLQLELDPAGRIEGRCVFEGEPVTDFEVLYWPGDRVKQLWNDAWTGREDGSFVLEAVSAGEVCLVAHGRGHGQSEISRVHVEPGGVTEVVLELSKGCRGSGTVVDQLSGEAVIGATVQLYATQGARPIYRTGPSVTTDSEGRFELDGLSEVLSSFRITADGYAGRVVPVAAKEAAALDLGKIALPRAQALEVRLHLADGDDPTEYMVSTTARGLRPTRFSDEGVVVVEDFKAGTPTFEVEIPSGGMVHKYVELVPGQDWVIDIPLDGTASLVLEVEAADGAELPPDIWADVRFATDSGDVLRTVTVPESGRVVFERLDPGPAFIEITDDVRTFAGQEVTLLAGQQTVASVALDGRMYVFRVVDEAGQALPSTTVRFSLAGKPTAKLGGTTDSHGELRSAGLAGESVTAHLRHAQLGVATNIPVRLPADASESVILEFEATAALSVRLRDGDEPAFGMSCQLLAHEAAFAAGPRRTTGADGRIRWEPLSTGIYELLADHPDYWPLRATLAAGEEHDLQVRRRSELVVSVKGAQGTALPGVAVRLRSVEFDADVRAWVEAGQVLAEPDSMITDSGGQLRIRGLPHGEYDWELRSVGAALQSGRVRVPRDQAGSVRFVLP